MPLRHQLQVIADRQRQVETAAHERLDKLSDAQLKWKPDDKTWSIAFIIDHLIKVHVETSEAFMRALQPAPPAGDEVDKELNYGFSERMMVNMVSPGAKFKLPVPKLYQPVAHGGSAHRLVEKLYSEFEAFRVILEYANEKKLKGLHVKSPVGGKPGALAYLDATTQHNRYHWLQVEAILRNREFPQS